MDVELSMKLSRIEFRIYINVSSLYLVFSLTVTFHVQIMSGGPRPRRVTLAMTLLFTAAIIKRCIKAHVYVGSVSDSSIADSLRLASVLAGYRERFIVERYESVLAI